MDFKLSEEQQMLQETAARLVRGEYEFEKRESYRQSELGFSEGFWQQLSELGLTAVPFSEEFGGFGGGGLETQLVMTELGRRSEERRVGKEGEEGGRRGGERQKR